MIKPAIPHNEEERLSELYSFSILDTLSERDFNNLTMIASEICNTPISLVSLIDNKRQWFKSHHGLDATETPKEYAFCAHAINQPSEIFIIPDSRLDDRFHDNPLVTDDPNVIFYAGVPLVSENGFPLGTLCVIDNEPKELNETQITSLIALRDQVMSLMTLRKNKRSLEDAQLELEERNQELELFAHRAAHDIKSPLINISQLSQILTETYASVIDPKGLQILDFIKQSSDTLKGLVDGILSFSRSHSILNNTKSRFKSDAILGGLKGILINDPTYTISLSSEIKELYMNKAALEIILLNLISNAIKYSDKELTKVTIDITEKESQYLFTVHDNGIGIEAENQTKIFNLFETLGEDDKFGKKGTGIGLATVKKLVRAMGGEISVESNAKEGCTFSFSIQK